MVDIFEDEVVEYRPVGGQVQIIDEQITYNTPVRGEGGYRVESNSRGGTGGYYLEEEEEVYEEVVEINDNAYAGDVYVEETVFVNAEVL